MLKMKTLSLRFFYALKWEGDEKRRLPVAYIRPIGAAKCIKCIRRIDILIAKTASN